MIDKKMLLDIMTPELVQKLKNEEYLETCTQLIKAEYGIYTGEFKGYKADKHDYIIEQLKIKLNSQKEEFLNKYPEISKCFK